MSISNQRLVDCLRPPSLPASCSPQSLLSRLPSLFLLFPLRERGKGVCPSGGLCPCFLVGRLFSDRPRHVELCNTSGYVFLCSAVSGCLWSSWCRPQHAGGHSGHRWPAECVRESTLLRDPREGEAAGLLDVPEFAPCTPEEQGTGPGEQQGFQKVLCPHWSCALCHPCLGGDVRSLQGLAQASPPSVASFPEPLGGPLGEAKRRGLPWLGAPTDSQPWCSGGLCGPVGACGWFFGSHWPTMSRFKTLQPVFMYLFVSLK